MYLYDMTVMMAHLLKKIQELESRVVTAESDRAMMQAIFLEKTNDLEARLKIAETDRIAAEDDCKAMQARLQTAEADHNTAKADQKMMQTRLFETAQASEAQFLVSNEKIDDLEARAKTAEAEIEVLKQRLIADKTWSVMRNVQGLIEDAIRNVHELPGHTIVPHMRTMSEFESDAKAIKTAPSKEELDSANRYIKWLNLEISVQDFLLSKASRTPPR